MKPVIVVVPLAAVAGWLLHAPAAPSPAPVLHTAAAPPPITGEAPSIELAPAQAVAPASPLRNLFSFVEPPPRPIPREEPRPVAASVTVAVPQPQPVVAVTPPQPEFPYRCIGVFGPASRRFAVFNNAGEIINAEVGQGVGPSGFVLRDIGVETITVESQGVIRRIEIGR